MDGFWQILLWQLTEPLALAVSLPLLPEVTVPQAAWAEAVMQQHLHAAPAHLVILEVSRAQQTPGLMEESKA